MWKSKTPGIPDEEFDRTESVPITKEEIRAIQISKGRLSAGQIVLDIGCGSGSVTVESAIQVENSGKVMDFSDHIAISILFSCGKRSPGKLFRTFRESFSTFSSLLNFVRRRDFFQTLAPTRFD